MSTLEVYDTKTESLQPLTRERLAELRQMAWAYGKVREARAHASSLSWLQIEMERIHADMLRRLQP